MIALSHIDATGKARGRGRRLALTEPLNLRGVTVPELSGVYHNTRENMDEYTRRNVANRFPEPTSEELTAFLRNVIESYADGLGQAPWEIHCAATLIKKLEGGAP